MLSKNAKLYIEEMLRNKYLKLDNSKDNIKNLRNKIGNFDKLLELSLNLNEYSIEITEMVTEIERVTLERGKINFEKVANINLILKLVKIIKNIELAENEPLSYVFLKLKLIQDIELFDKLFNKNLKTEITFNKIKEVGQNLKITQNSQFIPYITAYYFCSNPELFTKVIEAPIDIYWEYFSNLFLTYIELANKIKSELIEKYTLKQLDLDNYLNNIISAYESKINFKYIPSSVRFESNNEFFNDNFEQDSAEDLLSFIEVNNNPELKKIKLIGYAGVGKSTTLEYIEYEDAKKYKSTGKIPVIVNLITVENVEETVEKLIARKLNITEEDTDLIQYLLKFNSLNLYLDGVNEVSISDSYDKKQFLDKIEEFVKRNENRNLKIIVTDRDNDEVSILNDCATFVIQGMSGNDINAFIEGNTKSDKIEQVKAELAKYSEIISGNVNPLILKNIITIIECGEKLPEDAEELTEIYLNSIIDREINEKKENAAQYINDILTYMVKVTNERNDWTSNSPTSYYKVIDIFNAYIDEKNIDLDAEYMLDLLKKMGILKEVEFEKYAFLDEKYFHIYYYNAIISE